MNKTDILNKIGITSKQLDLLEYDYMKVHKENVDRILKMKDKYEQWYVDALNEWREKKKFFYED